MGVFRDATSRYFQPMKSPWFWALTLVFAAIGIFGEWMGWWGHLPDLFWNLFR